MQTTSTELAIYIP